MSIYLDKTAFSVSFSARYEGLSVLDPRHKGDITLVDNIRYLPAIPCPEMHFKGNLRINLSLERMPMPLYMEDQW